MASSIYQQLNNNNNNNFLNFFQNPQNFINQFNNFKKTLQGNPEQIGHQLLKDGRMSQQQYNYYKQIASQLIKILPNN